MYDTVHISRTLRPGETVAAALSDDQSIREHEFTAAHLARRRPASGTAYYGAAGNPALVGVGEANNLALLTIAEAPLGQRLSPWPLEDILADAAIAEALLSLEVSPGDVPHGHAIGVPVYATSTVAGPVMGIPVDPTNHSANHRAYYDAYYNAYYNASRNGDRPASDPADDSTGTEHMATFRATLATRLAVELDFIETESRRQNAAVGVAEPDQTHNAGGHIASNNRPANDPANDSLARRTWLGHNTVGITYLRSDVGVVDPEVPPNGQGVFRAMLRGSSRRQDNRRPRICITDDWRRHCPWAARLQRVERLTEETERLVESVERLSRVSIVDSLPTTELSV